MMENLETMRWFLEFAVYLAGGIAIVLKTMRDKDSFDLVKTLEAAADVAEGAIDRLKDEDAPDLDKLVDQVEGLRQKKLSKKLREKAKARIQARLKK